MGTSLLVVMLAFSPMAAAEDEASGAEETSPAEEAAPKARKNDPATMNPTLREDWRKVYWQGRNKVRKSIIIGGAGLALAGTGLVIISAQQAEGEAAAASGDVGGVFGAGAKTIGAGLFMVVPGTITTYVAGGMTAGASARSHRGLKKMGYTKELPYYSYLSWTALFTPFFIESSYELLLLPVAYGFGVMQVHHDKKRYEAGVEKYEPSSFFRVNIAPIANARMKGLGVQGTF